MRKDPTEFRKRFAKWKAGENPYKNGRISDEEYVRTMEKVAADNWLKWGEDSEDAALTRILNDNTYDYRGYYSKYPNSAANADTHWSDEFKTVWHPTFSLESTYSGKKSQFNPYGYPGGTWQGELFNPLWYQQHLGTGFYKDGYPKLPKFEGGEEKFKLKKTPEFVQAGKDNSWSKVTNDDMGEVFQSIVARPNRTGGNTSAGNWKKLWEPKYEKPLEIVSPEFDILTGVRAMMPSLHGADRKAYQFARKMSVDKSKMQNVLDAFRNSEWNNFLSTKNGDFYYRMAKTAENGTKSANENYFISHTTPWEEFAGMNIGAQNASALTGEVKNGILHLYEFPTKTFGQLKSSSWEGVLGDTNVSTMGKKHLLYGDTSSGVRGPVRILSDKNAEYLGTSPYKIGVSERPLTNNGMYDKSPVYEDIHMGNLTVISGDKLNSALNNTTYNHYYPVQGGIQKELHVAPRKTSTPALILWIDAQKPLSAKDVPTIEWSEATAPRITPDNAASITPAQWTAAQDAAIARGDMAEAQRLRDLHFMAKTPNNKITSKLYHGTDATWTEYNPSFFSSGSGDQGVFGKGLYLSQYPEVSKRYGKNMMELYAYSKNPYTADRGFELFDDAAYAFNRYENSEKLFPVLKGKDAVTSPRMVMEGGWKFHYEPNEEVVIPRGEQIKSADAVTYDNKGVRIPLGKRDNFNINDIRYGIIPLISGSTGYGLYNKYAE